jgi:enoyl-CoA hydratase/carnithine racemase
MNNGIEYGVNEGIAELRVNRPQARNALDWTAQEGFAAAVTTVSQDPAVRVLIVTGAGKKSFVAGGDLKELSHHLETAAGQRLNRVMSAALAQLVALPIPVIAAVNGDAFGGGCEILTACDLRLAADHARFSFAQVKNALTTGWGGTGRLVWLVGQSRAVELLLTARLFDAAEGKRLGLIHRVVPAGEVQVAARAWAEELVALPRQALAATKELVRTVPQLSPAEISRYEAELFTDLWAQPDHREALAAFVEKRPPRFNQD